MTEISNETRFLHAVEMGLGAWQWGDRVVWQYGNGYGDEDVQKVFEVSLAEGIRFVDTAEVYGNGRSERLLGRFIRETDQQFTNHMLRAIFQEIKINANGDITSVTIKK